MKLFTIIFYSSLAGFATILGTFFILYKEEWSRRNAHYIISFAAGSMLAAAFVHMLPESIRLCNPAPIWVLAGILLFYLIQNIISLHPCHDQECEIHRLGVISIIGLAFHSFLDGVAIVVGFEISAGIGLVTTLAVLLHEFPEGITTTGILIYTKTERRKLIFYSILVAIATPIGALISYVLLKNISGVILGALLSLAAGSFIYIATADLIPETHKVSNIKNTFVFLSGVLILAIIGRFFG